MTNGEATASVTHTVQNTHTAITLGSGNVPVLATPMVIAWCEQATLKTLELPGPGVESVGVHIDVRHLAASPVGAQVTATATIVSRTDKAVEFEVAAHDGDKVVAQGTITRAIVDRERFLSKLV